MQKRRGPQKKAAKKVTKPFRAPRARQQPSVIPGLLRQTGAEKKVMATNTGQMVLNSTGSIIALNLIQVGSSMFNRIGRKIEMLSVRIVFDINIPNATRASDIDLCKIAIVYDRQTNGAYPALADIFQDTDQTGANSTTPESGLNMNNRERFVTIMDIKKSMPSATNTAGVLTDVFPNGSSEWTMVDEFRKLRGLTTHYKADSNPAVIGDIATGALYLVTLGGLVAASENFVIANAVVRLKYTDL